MNSPAPSLSPAGSCYRWSNCALLLFIGLGGFVAYFTGGFVNGITGMILEKTGSYVTVFAYFSGMCLLSLLLVHLLVPRIGPADARTG